MIEEVEEVVTGKDEGSLWWRKRAYVLMMKSAMLIGHGTSVDVHKASVC